MHFFDRRDLGDEFATPKGEGGGTLKLKYAPAPHAINSSSFQKQAVPEAPRPISDTTLAVGGLLGDSLLSLVNAQP
jgi:hypothetical protein